MNVEHRPAAHRFSVPFGQDDAYLEYEEIGGRTLDLLHTIVPPAEQGRGVGAELVEHALRYAREHDYRVVPSCPFIQRWLGEHPEYDDLVAEG